MKLHSQFALRRDRLSVITGAALLGFACVYPTERSSDLTVEMDPIPPLLDGELDSIVARVLDPTGAVVPDIPISFSSSNGTVALVTETGVLFASGPGNVEISAEPTGFEGATPATQTVLVKELVAIDSVRPRLRRYGETVDIYGVGLSPAVLYTLGGQAVPFHSWTPEDPRRPERFGVLRLWVAPPAPRVSLPFIVKQSGSALGADSVIITPRDIFEPNDESPADLGTITTFENPALFFEQRFRDDSLPLDWYRFTTPAEGNRTITVQSTQVNTFGYVPLVSNKAVWQPESLTLAFDSDTWVISPGLQVCRGLPIEITFTPGPMFRVAAEDLPASTYDLVLLYLFPGAGYGLTVHDSYQFFRQPDGAEENDVCNRAAPLTLGGAARLLTIDNPYDPDWFSFSLDAPATVNFNVEATSVGTGALDPDLDLRIFENHVPDSLVLVGISTLDGNTDQAGATLGAGNYLLLVTDFAGVPTAYRLSNSIVPAPPGAEPTAPIDVHRRTDV